MPRELIVEGGRCNAIELEYILKGADKDMPINIYISGYYYGIGYIIIADDHIAISLTDSRSLDPQRK